MFDSKRFFEMLSYKRPYVVGSCPVRDEFISKYLLPVAQEFPHRIDGHGNLEVDLRQDTTHRTLFASHIDTVHYEAGRQMVMYDASAGYIHAIEECLGADDTAGIALMLHMIEARIPALYVFFDGEEVGCKGSSAYVRENAQWIEASIDRVVSFDRRGTYSVITHQMGQRCSSEEFAEALSEQLSNDELMYAPDPTGSFTDSAQFMDVVAECTNISVGYENEHTGSEMQDLNHLEALARRLVEVDFDALPKQRDPRLVENPWGEDMYSGLSVVDGLDGELLDAIEEFMHGSREWLDDIVAYIVGLDEEGAPGVDYATAYDMVQGTFWETRELEAMRDRVETNGADPFEEVSQLWARRVMQVKGTGQED